MGRFMSATLTERDRPFVPAGGALFAGRLLIGALQGILLQQVLPAPFWGVAPDPHPYWTSITALCLLLVPGAVMLAMPALTARRAAACAALLCAVFAGLAAYHVWCLSGGAASGGDLAGGVTAKVVLGLFHPLFSAWFIAQALLVAGVRDGRAIARYAIYFDVAWSQAAQIVLGAIFALLLWGVLLLGAELFAIIGLHGLMETVEKRWFVLPLLSTGFAASVNVTDLRVVLLRTSRSLFLTLAAWLLPVLAGLSAAFLLALPVTGLSLLWATHHAGGFLVAAAFLLVLLINAVFGDGTEATAPSRVLRWCASGACFLLAPMVGLAGYGALSRTGQYGLTPARIFQLADVLVAGVYAVCYPLAALRAGPWLGGLRRANIGAAYLVIGLVLALWSPLADPWRLSVADQVARLRDGRVAAEKFDYAFLRRSGRYGQAALREMQAGWTGRDAEIVKRLAAGAGIAGRNETLDRLTGPQLADRRRAVLTVYPAGVALPDSLLQQVFPPDVFVLPACLRSAALKCDAIMLDIMGQGRPQVLLVPAQSWAPLALLVQDSEGGAWAVAATATLPPGCSDMVDRLRQGQFSIAARKIPDLAVGDQILSFQPARRGGCTKLLK